jgi:hypothetical protein
MRGDRLDLAAATECARAIIGDRQFPGFDHAGPIITGKEFIEWAKEIESQRRKSQRRKLPSTAVLAEMIEAAQTGNDKAARTLLEISSDLVNSEREFPRLLSCYLVSVISRQQAAMNKKRSGRKKRTNFKRDYAVAAAISELQSFGYNPTRNREEKQRESGCSIVVKVLAAERNLYLSEAAVEKIWERRSNRFKSLYERIRP